MTKKLLISIFLLSVCSLILDCIGQAPLFAQSDLERNINEQIKDLDLSCLESLFFSFNKSFSFKEIFNNILNGNFSFDASLILKYILTITKTSLKNSVAPFLIIFIICILGYVLKHSASEKTATNVENVIHLGIISIVSIIIVKLVMGCIIDAKEIFVNLKSIMEISFPIILTLMATSGAKASVSIYQPIMTLLSGSIIEVFVNILLPVFIIIIVLCIADSLTDNVKLSNFSNLLTKIYKWAIGLIFGVFSSILTIFGITAGGYDTISFKTAQYSIKNYIPIVGGYLSGGFNIIACSSILIKNSLGLVCFIFIIVMLLKPIINILVIKLFLGILSSVLQNIADNKILKFFNNISKALNMLIAITFVICAMFLIFLSLCIVTGSMV